jgi:hypothetical protein
MRRRIKGEKKKEKESIEFIKTRTFPCVACLMPTRQLCHVRRATLDETRPCTLLRPQLMTRIEMTLTSREFIRVNCREFVYTALFIFAFTHLVNVLCLPCWWKRAVKRLQEHADAATVSFKSGMVASQEKSGSTRCCRCCSLLGVGGAASGEIFGCAAATRLVVAVSRTHARTPNMAH